MLGESSVRRLFHRLMGYSRLVFLNFFGVIVMADETDDRVGLVPDDDDDELDDLSEDAGEPDDGEPEDLLEGDEIEDREDEDDFDPDLDLDNDDPEDEDDTKYAEDPLGDTNSV